MKRSFLIMLFALLSVVSCTREETGGSIGNCSFRISFSTGEIRTRAVTPGDGNVADGGGIYINPSTDEPDLVILVASTSSGSVVATFPDDVAESGVDSKLESNSTAKQMYVTFTGLDAGPYTVYAFANTGGFWPMEGQGGSAAKDYLLSLTTASAVESLRFSDLFATVEDSVCPNSEDSPALRLPLSAKGTVNVSSLHTGEVSLEMIRCVAKVTAEFINNTGKNLTLYDYSNTLSGMCPNRGFVIEGNPDYPTGTLAGDILSTESSLYIPAVDPLDATKLGSTTKYWYVFPSSGPYTCDVEFTLFKGDPSKQHAYSYNDLPVHDDHAVSIPYLRRNQHLHIVTKISEGTTVSFNFEVTGWGLPVEERVLFD